MFVRMKIGAYAGEIRDLTFDAAKALLEAGDAEKIHPDILAPSPRSERIENSHVMVVVGTGGGSTRPKGKKHR